MRTVLIGLSLLLAVVGATAETRVEFVVIVNAENPSASLRPSTVAGLFLKRAGKWGNGLKSDPVDLIESSTTRRVFSRQVLGLDVDNIEQYWQKAIFSGRDMPPPKKATEGEVVAFVASRAGGIGYVSRTTPLKAGVKTIRLLKE
jgi:ABC-type phosphate transport system substrate-binding protein